MRQRLIAVVAACLILTGCGFVPGLTVGPPDWCGVSPGGRALLPPDTPDPIYTPDPQTLLCYTVENKSTVDMAVVDPSDSWGRVTACGDESGSEGVPTQPWKFEVGRAGNTENLGDPVATFDSSQVTGAPPYLFWITIKPDLSVTFEQRDSLPEWVTGSNC